MTSATHTRYGVLLDCHGRCVRPWTPAQLKSRSANQFNIGTLMCVGGECRIVNRLVKVCFFAKENFHMSDVDQWDPDSMGLKAHHQSILTRAWQERRGNQLCLEQSDLSALKSTVLAKPQDWVRFATEVDDSTIIDWIKVLTLCEEQYPGFEWGAKSPVIPLVRVLRSRRTYPEDLTGWIKANSNNRFLPYGSLLDRL